MTKQFTSVWTREPRQAKSTPGLSRDQIVRAALELLEAEGIDGLSMRKLGAKLSAGATSVYWYVANKEELLELAYDEIWGEMTVPDPATVPWRHAVASFAHSMRQVILRHSWSAGLIGRMPAIGPNALSVTDRLRRAFVLAGFEGLELDYATATLVAYIFGMTIPEVSWNAYVAENEPDEESVRRAVAIAAADYPEMMERFTAVQDADPRAMREMCFDFGLYSVLDGLEARLVT